MSSHPDTSHRAQTLHEADTRSIGRLRELLLAERAAISRRDFAALEETAQRKLDCVQQLERNEVERKRLVGHGDAAGWPRLLETLDPPLAESWERLRSQLAELAEINAANEQILSRTRRSTARLLALLRGEIDSPAGVYDRQGRTHACGDLRAITRA